MLFPTSSVTISSASSMRPGGMASACIDRRTQATEGGSAGTRGRNRRTVPGSRETPFAPIASIYPSRGGATRVASAPEGFVPFTTGERVRPARRKELEGRRQSMLAAMGLGVIGTILVLVVVVAVVMWLVRRA